MPEENATISGGGVIGASRAALLLANGLKVTVSDPLRGLKTQSMVHLVFDRTIDADPQAVFDRLADLRAYDRWLPRSAAFRGTTQISDGPIGVGTTYIEGSPMGIRSGRVTEFTRPTALGFEQPMTLKPRWAGRLDIHLTHVLRPVERGAYLTRELEIAGSGLVKIFMPWVVRAFRAENVRMLDVLAGCYQR